MAWTACRRASIGPSDPPRPVIGGRAVDEDERRPGSRGEHRDRRAVGRADDARRSSREGEAGHRRQRSPRRRALRRPGARTVNRAPGARRRRFAAWIVPPWRSAIQRAIARPRPVPPLGASGARQNRSNTWSRCAGSIPGPSSSTVSHAPGPAVDRHATARRGVADRVVDEDRGQLPKAGLVAADRRRHDLEHQPHATLRGHRLQRLGRLGCGVREIGVGHRRARPPRRRCGRAAAGRRRGAPSGPHRRRGRRSPGRRSPGRRVRAAAPRSRPG